jgi:hypothetical protein
LLLVDRVLKRTGPASLGLRRLCVVALLASSGCYVTAPIKPSQLALLDGYQDGEPKGGTVAVLTPTDQTVEIGGDSKIFLDLQDGTHGGDFRAIEVKDGIFYGETTKGQAMQVPLTSIQAARVKEPNRPAMALLYFFVATGTILLLGSAVVLYADGVGRGPVNGRALRIAHRVVTARATDAEGWEAGRSLAPAASLSPEVRRALAGLWTESGRSEHASVPAFSRLSLSLVALGAPAHLVEAAHRAALEEIEHARLAFSLAGAYAGAPVGPAQLPQLRRARAVTARSLPELCAESLLDGCLLEGVAAEVARRSLARARDPDARAALEVIARDEASHAALAWDVVRWCCERGGAPVRRRLTATLKRFPASVAPPAIPETLAATLADHGWPGRETWEDAFRSTLATVTARVSALGAT